MFIEGLLRVYIGVIYMGHTGLIQGLYRGYKGFIQVSYRGIQGLYRCYLGVI